MGRLIPLKIRPDFIRGDIIYTHGSMFGDVITDMYPVHIAELVQYIDKSA